MTTRRQHPFGGRLLVVLDFGPMDARVADVLSFGRDVSRAHRGVTGRRRAGWPGGGRTSLAHSRRMRIKTSITIDARVLEAIDNATTRSRSRSRLIEDAVREFLARRARARSEARDFSILNASAADLNEQMNDVLGYQASYSRPASRPRRPSPIRRNGAQ